MRYLLIAGLTKNHSMCSVTQKKNILHTLNAIHTQCSVGHEIFTEKKKKTRGMFFVGPTDGFVERNILSQQKHRVS